MTDERKRTIQIILTLLAVIFIAMGTLSYFSITSLGYYWVPADAGTTVTHIGTFSFGGGLGISFSRLPRAYYDDIVSRQTWRMSANHGWNRFFAWTQLPIFWWFRHRMGEYVVPVLTPRASTRPATTFYFLADLVVPYWFLVLITAPYPAIRLLDLRNRKLRARFAAGQCLSCGYDLRHSPHRCPECGTVPATTPPPRKSLSSALWFRIIIGYPIFLMLFSIFFTYAYLWWYRK